MGLFLGIMQLVLTVRFVDCFAYFRAIEGEIGCVWIINFIQKLR